MIHYFSFQAFPVTIYVSCQLILLFPFSFYLPPIAIPCRYINFPCLLDSLVTLPVYWNILCPLAPYIFPGISHFFPYVYRDTFCVSYYLACPLPPFQSPYPSTATIPVLCQLTSSLLPPCLFYTNLLMSSATSLVLCHLT